MTTATILNTISVTEASNQLGIDEPDFRKLLKGLYKNPGTVKKISLDNYKVIAETLKSSAEAEAEAEAEIEPEGEAEIEPESEITPEIEAETITEIKNDEQTEVDSDSLPEQTSLATSDPQALDIPQDKARTQLNINLNLSNQVLDLNKISSALAIVAGEAAVRNFEELYTHTVNTGIDRVIQTVASQTYKTIQQLHEVDNADFLTLNGRDTNPVDTQTAITLVSQFL